MWGWLYNHVGKVAAVAGAVVGAAVVVLVPSLAVGKVVVAAVSVGAGAVAGGVAYGLKSFYEYAVKVGEAKTAAITKPQPAVVSAQDTAIKEQDKFKVDFELKMQAVVAKSNADQAKLIVEKKKLNDDLEQTQTKLVTATNQINQLQQQVDTKTDELTKKTAECDQLKKDVEKIRESHQSTKGLLADLIDRVKQDSDTIEELTKQIKTQEPANTSNPTTTVKGTATQRLFGSPSSTSDDEKNLKFK